jgi:hypothetical protein
VGVDPGLYASRRPRSAKNTRQILESLLPALAEIAELLVEIHHHSEKAFSEVIEHAIREAALSQDLENDLLCRPVIRIRVYENSFQATSVHEIHKIAPAFANLRGYFAESPDVRPHACCPPKILTICSSSC